MRRGTDRQGRLMLARSPSIAVMTPWSLRVAERRLRKPFTPDALLATISECLLQCRISRTRLLAARLRQAASPVAVIA